MLLVRRWMGPRLPAVARLSRFTAREARRDVAGLRIPESVSRLCPIWLSVVTRADDFPERPLMERRADRRAVACQPSSGSLPAASAASISDRMK